MHTWSNSDGHWAGFQYGFVSYEEIVLNPLWLPLTKSWWKNFIFGEIYLLDWYIKNQ